MNQYTYYNYYEANFSAKFYQLFDPDSGQAAAAANAINNAINIVLERAGPPPDAWRAHLFRLVREIVLPVLDRWGDVGAADSEGLYAVVEALRTLTGCEDLSRSEI
jgi:hypothetical protein